MDETAQKRANIGFVWDAFRNNFFGKTETGIPETSIAVHKLEEDSLDKPIMEALGNRTEISLAHFIGLIEKQANGQTGFLLTNGYANTAYIRDKHGKLWAVYCRWDSGCGFWFVSALSFARSDRWGAGSRILSRDS